MTIMMMMSLKNFQTVDIHNKDRLSVGLLGGSNSDYDVDDDNVDDDDDDDDDDDGDDDDNTQHTFMPASMGLRSPKGSSLD